MTRLPLERRDIVGVDGPEYDLNVICAVPGCLEPSADPHHCWRRSELGGPFWWVVVDKIAIGNVIGLCELHHHAVTVNAAFVRWGDGQYEWNDLFSSAQPLSFQPPVVAPERLSLPVSEPESAAENGAGQTAPAVEGACPTCLRPLPVHRDKPETKRLRRTWSVTVPVDERENGAEMLSTLLEEARREMAKAGLPYGNEDSAKYFILATVLALFVQHSDALMSNA